MNSYFLQLKEQMNWSFWCLLGALAMSLILVSVPSVRRSLIQDSKSGSTEILSVVDAPTSIRAPITKVIKLKTDKGIRLEIYGPPTHLDKNAISSEPSILLDSFLIGDPYDAYFDLQGRSTNLGLQDVDNDGDLDIISPTYDRDWVPRLNVVKYDPKSERFIYLNQD